MYLVELGTKLLLVALQYIHLSLSKCLLAFTHTRGAVFLGAVGIFSPNTLTGNFRLAKLCLQDASRALVFPPKMGQVLALPTYLKVLLYDPEEIFIQDTWDKGGGLPLPSHTKQWKYCDEGQCKLEKVGCPNLLLLKIIIALS